MVVRGARGAAFFCVALSGTAACVNLSALSSEAGSDASLDVGAEAEPGSDGGRSVTDGGAFDASLDVVSPPGDAVSATDAEADQAGAGPNLLSNPDFELGCAAWNAAFGTTSASTDAHGGSGSCEFCMGTNWEAFFSQKVTTPVAPSASYVARIWAKAASSLAALEDAGLVGEELLIATSGSDKTTASITPVTSSWSQITALLSTTSSSAGISLELRLQQTGNPAAQGGVICVVLDDAALYRMQ